MAAGGAELSIETVLAARSALTAAWASTLYTAFSITPTQWPQLMSGTLSLIMSLSFFIWSGPLWDDRQIGLASVTRSSAVKNFCG
jgi:hypothetical protein